ncbi:MAG: bifunctional homocysteine S-methyltransferase/methylenetetrahydrofolate reductase [Acidobacteria bacterium]|nr:MAG: bifunctional homocysteine S-methyltransferase/methylenetetrahydrofolate reductase [Acidobacteriota bacterium]
MRSLIKPFLSEIEARVLVCDGAMGTMLYSKGIFLNKCFDELNLTQPNLVLEVHQGYVRAGADVIETNTFGANRFKLSTFGLADQRRAINVEGARLAKRAARDAAWVAGSIGPLGVRIEPWGKTGVTDAEAAFREQAEALVEGGVDLFMLETFRDVNELAAAVRAVRSVSQLPIVAQMTTEDDGNSLDGTPPETFAPRLEAAGADVIGVNCSVGPAAMLETLERMGRATGKRLSAQPNAGRPRDVDGRNLYLCSPDYMASYARRFIDAGARLVGGCCGTTPEHIRQIKQAVRQIADVGRSFSSGPKAAGAEAPAYFPTVARGEKSALAKALAAGQFVTIAEVGTPRGMETGSALAAAKRYAALGATAINVPDYQRSAGHVSALALSQLIAASGIETVLHYSCRERSLIGMQSDLLGAHAMGLRNVLLVTGEPPSQGTYADATAIDDVDSIGLTNMVASLNRGLDIGGQSLGRAAAFHIGVAVNPNAPSLDTEWKRLDYKVEAGAEYILTPPILDVAAFQRVLPRLRATGLPVIAGLAALETARQVDFIASEVSDVAVSADVVARMRAATDPAAEGLAISLEIFNALRSSVHGVAIRGLHGSPASVERFLEAVRG